MGKLRARLARSAPDAQVQGHVAAAQRSLQAAIRVARRTRTRGAVNSRHALRVERDLARAASALGNIGRLTPLHDMDDPDLNPEALERWREGRKQQPQVELPTPPPVSEDEVE